MRIQAKHIALSLVGLLGLAAIGFWFVFVSPLGYEPPAEKDLYGEPPHQVFVYGTLTHPAVRWLIIRRPVQTEPAVLTNYRKEGLDLVRAEGERTEGLLLTIDTEAFRRLDRYERLGVHYDRIRVRLKDDTEAWAYTRVVSNDQGNS